MFPFLLALTGIGGGSVLGVAAFPRGRPVEKF
ncbi:hypothetical protein Rrhod_3812 [Rhodococcus rhodnii LMG 5362]|uniref:Uncharacterized protein n=1 Tax=Rhodococcus rhodnii LMG 5362 TaxID=1273125 RepID=R7WLQ8_9NOCA|nr:hypothetical protein Rrhod_3812 [Rhodococcus rhodnii LMG 5362]